MYFCNGYLILMFKEESHLVLWDVLIKTLKLRTSTLRTNILLYNCLPVSLEKIWQSTISSTNHRTAPHLRLQYCVLIGWKIRKGSKFILRWQTGILLYESTFCSQSKRSQLALWDVLSKTVLWYHDSSGDFEQSMFNFWWMISQPATAQTVKVVNI